MDYPQPAFWVVLLAKNNPLTILSHENKRSVANP